MSQTSYSQNLAVATPGMIADNTDKDVMSKVNPVVAIPFGTGVCRGVNPDRDVKLPASPLEAAAIVGVALRDLSVENQRDGLVPNYPIGSPVACLKKGCVWVKVSVAVVAGDDVYCRYANGIADVTDTQAGSFGNTGDGIAQVDTVTPTAVNSTNYVLYVNGSTYEYLSDSSATAAEIVAGLLAEINANPDSPVTASGTNTLILTAKVAGTAFVTQVGPNLSVAHTTANAGSAARVPKAKFQTSSAADGFAILEVNFP